MTGNKGRERWVMTCRFLGRYEPWTLPFHSLCFNALATLIFIIFTVTIASNLPVNKMPALQPRCVVVVWQSNKLLDIYKEGKV